MRPLISAICRFVNKVANSDERRAVISGNFSRTLVANRLYVYNPTLIALINVTILKNIGV
jgi:hypothetical protein